MRLFSLFVVSSLALSVAACSKSKDAVEIPTHPSTPRLAEYEAPQDAGKKLKEGESETMTLNNGAKIVIQRRGGIIFHTLQATFTEKEFSSIASASSTLPKEKQREIFERQIDSIVRELQGLSIIGLKKYPEVGYFTLMVPFNRDTLRALRAKKLSHELLLDPVVTDPDVVKNVKAMTPAAEGLVPRNASRDSTKGFSGLERIHAPEFVAMAEADIGGGVKVDGSSVRLGVTDTGITLNHRTFLAKDRKTSRVIYMKDFTREGRVYFNLAAKFVVEPTDKEDLVKMKVAEVIVAPRLPDVPAGDQFVSLEEIELKVPKELKSAILAPDTRVRLGILSEKALSAAAAGGEENDINGNGKMDEIFPIILVPGERPEDSLLYADFTGAGDFTLTPPIGSWNKTHGTVPVFAEKMGFDIQADELPTANGEGKVEVISASLVGFDPGNHGSHVAGIAAGRKTIANDSEDTLARGVAPAASILMNRVCAVNVGCNATEAFIDLALNGSAEVINMSLGGLSPFNDGYGVEETLINRITSLRSVLFVISAGNSGPGRQTVGSPSVAKLSLSVGASATKGLVQRQYQWPGAGSSQAEDLDSDFMLFFSSRGPTAAGGFKPNVVAPGTELSSVQLNSAPGARGGLDVYWGTSMSAPTATGAYALFLDAVKKYNVLHQDKPLPTEAVVLREVLIQSARAFDVNSFDPISGLRREGQYTWIDQGTGMIDLTAAWKKLFEVRDNPLALSEDDVPVELEYDVIVPMKAPNGAAYDGSRAGSKGVPAFGRGLYLDFYGSETLKPVYIQRKLPELFAAGPLAGELTRRMLDTRDEFALKTVIYGSNKVWVKAGVRDELNCWDSDTANLSLIGRGVDVTVNPDSTGAVAAFNASVLNFCVNREMIHSQLEPGDHGALIFAYRIVNGKEATLPSFTVPIHLTVPHKSMNTSKAYEFEASINSFGVGRNYVFIPAGTSLVQVTLEVPELKTTANGIAAPGEKCSGVELMGYGAINASKLFPSRAAARISNCDAFGSPVREAAKRRLVFTAANPKSGMWDLHVFGLYKYIQSNYKVRVDYVNTRSGVEFIKGGLEALNGSFEWKVLDSSFEVKPDTQKSEFLLSGLTNRAEAQVENEKFVIVENPLGQLRKYPEGVKKVKIAIGGAPGSDLDLIVLECKQGLNDETACNPVASSGGATDEEEVQFSPEKGSLYGIRVDGYKVNGDGKFFSTETIAFEGEKGSIDISTSAQVSSVKYGFADLAKSVLATHDLFTSGKYDLAGEISLRSGDGLSLARIGVQVSSKK